MNLLEDEKDPGTVFCDLIDEYIPANHPYFQFESYGRLAMANIGLAISCGVRLSETRELLETMDTLLNNFSNPEEKLPDPIRKRLNHEEEVWLDLKSNFSGGEVRPAYLLSAHSFVKLAVAMLAELRKDEKFNTYVTDYLLNYMYKFSVALYREAIGHVLL